MDWSDTPEQAAFRDGVRTLIAERLPDYYRRKAAQRLPQGLSDHGDMKSADPEARAAARAWSAALLERGFSAPAWPREYGGGGYSPMEQFILSQEMAVAQAPAVVIGGATLIGAALIAHGTEEQKRRLLPKTLSGEYRWFQGFSEPGAGSDLAALQTRAVRDGDEYVINGQKLWGGSHDADWCFGLFRTDPDAPKHRGISFIVMDRQTPGIISRPIVTLGWEHSVDETFFEDVRVPADQLIGEEHRGWYVAMAVLDLERSNVGNVVVTRRHIDELLEHARTPLGRQQTAAGGLQRQRLAIAQHVIETEVLLNFSRRIISLQAAGLSINHEASASKIFASELIQRLSNTGMRVYGLYSYVWEPEHRYAAQQSLFTHHNLYSVVLTIYGGSNEIQRNIIATRGLGLPRG